VARVRAEKQSLSGQAADPEAVTDADPRRDVIALALAHALVASCNGGEVERITPTEGSAAAPMAMGMGMGPDLPLLVDESAIVGVNTDTALAPALYSFSTDGARLDWALGTIVDIALASPCDFLFLCEHKTPIYVWRADQLRKHRDADHAPTDLPMVRVLLEVLTKRPAHAGWRALLPRVQWSYAPSKLGGVTVKGVLCHRFLLCMADDFFRRAAEETFFVSTEEPVLGTADANNNVTIPWEWRFGKTISDNDRCAYIASLALVVFLLPDSNEAIDKWNSSGWNHASLLVNSLHNFHPARVVYFREGKTYWPGLLVDLHEQATAWVDQHAEGACTGVGSHPRTLHSLKSRVEHVFSSPNRHTTANRPQWKAESPPRKRRRYLENSVDASSNDEDDTDEASTEAHEPDVISHDDMVSNSASLGLERYIGECDVSMAQGIAEGRKIPVQYCPYTSSEFDKVDFGKFLLLNRETVDIQSQQQCFNQSTGLSSADAQDAPSSAKATTIPLTADAMQSMWSLGGNHISLCRSDQLRLLFSDWISLLTVNRWWSIVAALAAADEELMDKRTAALRAMQPSSQAAVSSGPVTISLSHRAADTPDRYLSDASFSCAESISLASVDMGISFQPEQGSDAKIRLLAGMLVTIQNNEIISRGIVDSCDGMSVTLIWEHELMDSIKGVGWSTIPLSSSSKIAIAIQRRVHSSEEAADISAEKPFAFFVAPTDITFWSSPQNALPELAANNWNDPVPSMLWPMLDHIKALEQKGTLQSLLFRGSEVCVPVLRASLYADVMSDFTSVIERLIVQSSMRKALCVYNRCGGYIRLAQLRLSRDTAEEVRTGLQYLYKLGVVAEKQSD
jgi:hypothetical protein